VKFDAKKFLILNLPFVLFFWLADKAGQAFRLAAGTDLSAKVLHLNGGFAAAFANPLPSLHLQDMLVGAIGAALIRIALHMKKANAKKYRKDVVFCKGRAWTAPNKYSSHGVAAQRTDKPQTQATSRKGKLCTR
jgi:type IV secretion system protein VirD4